LTSLCVFLPVIFIDKDIQSRYQGFVYTVCIALTFAMVVSVMFVPMILSKLDLRPSEAKKQTLGFERLSIGYQNWLSFGMKYRYWVLLTLSAVFAASLWGLIERDIDLPSQLQENEFSIIVFPLAGAKLDTNNEAGEKLEELLRSYDEVDMINTTVQKDDLRVFVKLVPKSQRQISKDAIMAEVREKGNELIKQIHDEYSLIVDEGAGSEEGKKMVVHIFGLENSELEKYAHEMAGRIQSIDGLTNLVMTDLRKRPEYNIVVDKGRAAFYRLTVRDIADSIHAQVRGMRPTKFHEVEKGLEIETITRLQPIYRQKIEDLQEIYVVSPIDNTQVLVKQISGFYPSRGPQTIDRKNKYRYVFLKGDVSRALETVAEEIKAALADLELPNDYFWRFGGAYEDLMKSKSTLGSGVILSIALIFMVLACLYQSYTEPLMIMISIPLAVIGVLAALMFTRKPLSEQVFIGMFILVGYAVNGAIILVDRINHLREEVPDTLTRVLRAGKDRLRPILITTVSTIIGFIPMALSPNESSELWAPLAITMIGGIVSSTFLTLFVIPIVFLCFEDLKAHFKKPQVALFSRKLPLQGS